MAAADFPTPCLFDMPVSNHGARIRMILKSKNLENNEIKLAPPSLIGGLKSPEYLSLNPQGKMPLYVTETGLPIPESDTIARYLIAKYKHIEPTFIPATIESAALSDTISRVHDIVISPIQGAMYR